MGNARGSNMSAIPQRGRRCNRQPVFHYHVPMVCRSIIRNEARSKCLSCLRTWPQPVLLKQIDEGPLPVRVWNPKVRSDHNL